MKRKRKILFYIAILMIYISSCKNNTSETVTDIDGNIYHTISIGNQVWMAENLKVTRYRNGDLIPNVSSKLQWCNLTSGAYCDYENNDTGFNAYGRLYNWYVVNDSRNIAPQGWHVPSDEELITLINYLGGEKEAGSKMKEAGTVHWQKPNLGANNKSGFSACPGGYRDNHYGVFHLINYSGWWWSATETDQINAWVRWLSFNDAYVFRNYAAKTSGFSIRCVMD